MKYTLFIITCLLIFSCQNSTERKITTELDYFPKQHTEITDELYRKWTIVLQNVYEKINVDSGNISYVGHLNIATSIIKLKGPKQKVLDQFHLAQQKNLSSTAELFPMIYSSFEKVDGYLTQQEYDSLLTKFEHIMSIRPVEEMNLKEYANEGGYNIKLVKLMSYILERDQEFRVSDMDKQNFNDKQNIKLIDSLYQVHEKYIGKLLVGKKFSSVMQIVIQHANLNYQEKYLSIVHQATKSGDLPLSSLKYLVDRVYNRKYGYQIFGTQADASLADNETIEEVKTEFGF